MSQHLLAPITLRDLTVRNRIWVPPMCQYSVAAQDGIATDWHLMHYGSLARGGAGAASPVVFSNSACPGSCRQNPAGHKAGSLCGV